MTTLSSLNQLKRSAHECVPWYAIHPLLIPKTMMIIINIKLLIATIIIIRIQIYNWEWHLKTANGGPYTKKWQLFVWHIITTKAPYGPGTDLRMPCTLQRTALTYEVSQFHSFNHENWLVDSNWLLSSATWHRKIAFGAFNGSIVCMLTGRSRKDNLFLISLNIEV